MTLESIISYIREEKPPWEREEFDRRLTQPYDGVIGKLDSWMPEQYQIEFLADRENLLNSGYSVDFISGWVNKLYECFVNEADPGSVPTAIMKEIRKLALYKYCSSLGEERGLNYLLGKGSIDKLVSIQQSKRAKGKTGTVGEVREIVRLLNPEDLNDLLKQFADNDKIEDLYESTINTTRLHAIEIHEDEEKVSYTNRAGKQKGVTFKTLSRYIKENKK